MDVYVAEYANNEFHRVGVFYSQFDAFIECLKDWKEFCFDITTVIDPQTRKWMRNLNIKDLRSYTITKETIR